MLNLLKNSKKVEVEAYIQTPKNYKVKINQHGQIDNTQFVMKLKLKIGARVMIISNIDIKDSLVNGSLGIILDIKQKEEQVLSVIVAFDDPKAGIEQRQRHRGDCFQYTEKNGVPIYRNLQKYQIPHRKNFKKHSATCQLKQFPLKLAWALTGHKVQGITIKKPNKLVVHGHPKMPPSMYYVMFSRAQDIEQVYVKNFTKLDLKM